MKTFRRYLLSYLLTLFLPVGILSIVISQIVLHYCAAQLLDSNAAALHQLNTAVSMQVTQFNAYAVQTTQRTEFYRRNREKTGAFFDVQRALLQWQMTNTLMDDVYFFTTGEDTVYAYNTVNPRRSFYTYRLAEAGFDLEDVTALLDGTADSPWLSAKNDQTETLLYAAYARVDPATQNGLLFRIDTGALRAMIDGAAMYDSSATYLCDASGRLLYTSGPDDEAVRMQVRQLIALPEDTGLANLGTETVLYARLCAPAQGLIFLNTVPQQVAHAPLARLWGMFFVGLLVIFALGGTVVALVMRVNYVPIRDLEKDVIASDVLSKPTNDAVQNVRKAIQTMQQNHSLIVRRSAALSKERVILRLLLGGYASTEAFNADAEALSLRLHGESWRILVVRGTGSDCEEEDFALQLVQSVRAQLGSEQVQLYLEVPENHMVIFIVAGEVQEAPEMLTARLQAQSCNVQAAVSDVCRHTTQLARAWTQIMQPTEETGSESAAAPEVYDALRNALEFGEAERIQFTLATLSNTLTPALNRAAAAQVCHDVLYLVRRWMEQQEDAEGIQALQDVAREAAVGTLSPCETCRQVVRQVSELLTARLDQKSQKENSLILDIETYINENYQDMDFTVQRAADHFQLSISNLSHYFKNHVGMSVSGYVEQLRMHAAQELLAQTDSSVSQIASEVGYAQPATFMRAFKKVSGMSPTAYRTMAREQAARGNF